eukprot:6750996-Alexandrium_andersonii.AAC.1
MAASRWLYTVTPRCPCGISSMSPQWCRLSATTKSPWRKWLSANSPQLDLVDLVHIEGCYVDAPVGSHWPIHTDTFPLHLLFG